MKKIWEIKFGSSLYGTRTANSDLDFKGVYLPSAKEIVLGNYKKTVATCRPKATCERNTKEDIDIEYFSLDRYLELLTEGQTVALDMLFAPVMSFNAEPTNELDWPGLDIFGEIWENREKLLTRNVNAFVGYARQQAAKYGIKGSRMDALKRTKEYLNNCEDHHKTLEYYSAHLANLVDECRQMVSLEKTPLLEIAMLKGPKGAFDAPHLRVNGRSIPFHAKVRYALEVVGKMLDGYGARANKAHLAGGVDWKALSHAVRVNSEAIELLLEKKITFPRPDRELLVNIKNGQISYEEVAGMIEQGLADLYEAHAKSDLRDEPDQEWVDNFIYSVYTKIVKESE